MATDFGTGVSRTLNAISRQFAGLVWQEGKPPLDSELNLVSQQAWEALRESIRAAMPSGFIMDPTRAMEEYQFDPLWSNRFVLGRPRDLIGTVEGLEQSPVILANVNGWIIPVLGTDVTDADHILANVIRLYPPPSSETRIDFVFLEAWVCRVDANPSTVNKPSAGKLWAFGNVKYAGMNIDDDLEDPAIGFSTTGRLQVQYRIRVHGQGQGAGASVNLATYPDGLGDPNILGQGTATSPVGGFQFVNMREALGDPSLWRAGDGDPSNGLGTVDGYTYAIPICAVFRRNTMSYVAVAESGLPNQNGAKDRTPHTKNLPNPLDGARILTKATVGAAIPYDLTLPADIRVIGLNRCGLEDPEFAPYTNTFIVIDNEIFGFDSIDLVAETVHVTSRGRYGTAVTRHEVGATVRIFNSRPDGLYADQIAGTDILDLRRAVNAQDWDFQRILQHNVAALVRGDLKTSWKKSVDGDTQGTTVHEVDFMLTHTGGAVPLGVQHVDGPDGIRTIFSDAACIQRDVVLRLNPAASKVNQWADNINPAIGTWDVQPDFQPAAFFNVAGFNAGPDIWANGTSIFLYLGGLDGNGGARASFRDTNTQAVRALMPEEFWKTGYPVVDPKNGNQYPVTMRWEGQAFCEPAPVDIKKTGYDPSFPSYAERHVGPMYPWREWDFMIPFAVLGGIVHPDLRITGRNVSTFTIAGATGYEIDVGINFNTYGVWYTTDTGAIGGDIQNDPSAVLKPLMNGRTTLWGLLTNNGKDPSGSSSKLFLITYGDKSSSGRNNNNLWKVVGVGTSRNVGGPGFTTSPASNATSVTIVPVGNVDGNNNPPVPGTGEVITLEFRSPYSNSDDLSGKTSGYADVAIVLTDIGGETSLHPWLRRDLGYNASDGYDISVDFDTTTNRPYIASDMLLNMTLLYHPGRGGTQRVPDNLLTFAKKYDVLDDQGAYLRQSQATVDSTFATNAGLPGNEIYWDPVHIQVWNRLPALGWHAPDAPDVVGAYGGNVVGSTEQDREHELFFDRGSKTILFRPFRSMGMSLQGETFNSGVLPTSLIGPLTYPDMAPKDCPKGGSGMWTTGKRMGFAIPREYMPRFGRQDIPFWKDLNAGAGPFMQGINHLFTDMSESTNIVFKIVGGDDNSGVGPKVRPCLFATGVGDPAVPTTYGHEGVLPAWTLNQYYIGARRTTDITNTCPDAAWIIDSLRSVNSSDFGKGLKGIQLPPYYGIVRLYGVYEAQDYHQKGGKTFNADRVTYNVDGPPNLLKEDGTNQTLFILEGGARDYTGTNYGDPSVTRDPGCVDDHTYIIPSNAIDITRSLHYTPGDKFEDHHYIVECVVFGFARGFINKNNYVLARLHDGSGALQTDGDDPLLEGVMMTIPCAANLNGNFYSAYNRTPYQGDPFMSRNGDAQANADYVERYGQLGVAEQYAIRTPIQQFDDVTGAFIPMTPNARVFEILATMDFYTTLGTGKIGGQMYPGTNLDVGFTEDLPASAARMPDKSDSAAWRVLPRAFTEGQRDNPTRAMLTLSLVPSTYNFSQTLGLNPAAFKHHRLRFGLLDGTYLDMYASFAAHVTDITGSGPGQLNLPASQVWLVDEGTSPSQPGNTQHIVYDTNLTGTILPGQMVEIPVNVPNVTTAARSSVSVELLGNSQPDLALYVRVDPATPDWAYVRVFHTWSEFAFENPSVGVAGHQSVVSHPGPLTTTLSIPVGGHAQIGNPFNVTGAQVGDLVLATGTPPNPATDQAIYIGRVIAPDTVVVDCYNVGTAPINGSPAAHTNVRVAILQQGVYSGRQIDMTALGLKARVTHTFTVGTLENCAWNLAKAINQHPALIRSMFAYARGNEVDLYAVPSGPDGNLLSVQSMFWSADPADEALGGKITLKTNQGPYVLGIGVSPTSRVSANFYGADPWPANAGNGNSQVNLTGMTERLPMGALLQDSDFLCENPLNDNASAMKSFSAGPRPIQTIMPLTANGEEFTRFMGEPGALIAQSDGSVCVTDYTPWTQTTPTGKRVFRTYRGGPLYMMSGSDPGGPIDWVTESFPASITPVLKGGALACRAMLVRNFYEEINAEGRTYAPTYGDEIQMIILTNGILGDGFTREDGVTLDGVVSPSGYGEGYAASDRYRIEGRPMFRGRSQYVPNPNTVRLAVYPDSQRQVPGR